jgi:hypothetical protein
LYHRRKILYSILEVSMFPEKSENSTAHSSTNVNNQGIWS